MSLIYEAPILLRDHGDMMPAQIREHRPEWPLKSIQRALQNGAIKGLCHVRARVRSPDGNGWKAVWAYGPAAPRLPPGETPRGEFGIPRVSSVWELGGLNAP